MKPREIVLEQIHHHETRPVPYSLSFEDGTDLQLDAYYGSTTWRERLVPYIVHTGGVDTIQLKPIDETRSRDAFGGIWRMDRRPWHLEAPPLPEPSFDHYTMPGPEQFVAPGMRESALARMAQYPDSFTVCSVGWGLFEQAWRLRGFENSLVDAIAEPDFYGELLDRLTELYLAHVAQCADVPADAIQFGDDWGDQRGVILGPDRWRRFLKPRWARIYEAVHAQGKLVITHCCGSIADIMPDLIEIGLDVLESVQPEAVGMNPYGLKARWGDRLTFYGCLGSQSIIPFGTPDEIRGEVRRLCREMGAGGGYILHPAKGIQPGTPPANMAAVLEAFTEQD